MTTVVTTAEKTGAAAEYLTVPELADLMRVTPVTARKLCGAGKIPGAAKVGWEWRIRRSAVEEMFAK